LRKRGHIRRPGREKSGTVTAARVFRKKLFSDAIIAYSGSFRTKFRALQENRRQSLPTEKAENGAMFSGSPGQKMPPAENTSRMRA
jgi:hypothetical protein